MAGTPVISAASNGMKSVVGPNMMRAGERAPLPTSTRTASNKPSGPRSPGTA
jgi:hypothetical protein